MLSLEEIEIRLKDRNLSEVARQTELAPPTIWRVANGKANNIGYLTVQKISDYLEQNP